VYLRSLAPETAAKAAAPAVQANNPGGKATYAMYCSTCHGNKGEGTDFAIPALAGNATVTADNPLTALRVVLEGAHTPATQHAMAFDMPAYGWA
ncbi:cytochrome c, partial [Klebsiella pneumoniae]